MADLAAIREALDSDPHPLVTLDAADVRDMLDQLDAALDAGELLALEAIALTSRAAGAPHLAARLQGLRDAIRPTPDHEPTPDPAATAYPTQGDMR